MEKLITLLRGEQEANNDRHGSRGNCAIGYKPGDIFTIEKFYIKDTGKGACPHAPAAVPAPPAPLLKGAPATALRNGKRRVQRAAP
jgi:uncharacterized repeat protein (TIGR04076 family)